MRIVRVRDPDPCVPRLAVHALGHAVVADVEVFALEAFEAVSEDRLRLRCNVGGNDKTNESRGEACRRKGGVSTYLTPIT